jgi:hypothetical protein
LVEQQAQTSAIPESVLAFTATWVTNFRDYWYDEIPLRLHNRDVAEDGSPQIHPDFARWLSVDYQGQRSDDRWSGNPEPRVRTTRAFRKLRKKAVREFEVCYRIIVLGDPIANTAVWLTDRAVRNGKEDRYGIHETLVLLASGVEKMVKWW